jgi:rhamnulokinase
MTRMLAFDFGASGGKCFLGSLENGILKLDEVHRFSNDPVKFNNFLHWDFLRFFFEIKQGILKSRDFGNIDSLGIDAWGVDFGLIDVDGELMGNPVHYRDKRTECMTERCFEIIPKEEMFLRTGIMTAQYNTVYQLLSMKHSKNGRLDSAFRILLAPDLLNYMLTGKITAEYTEATTTQLYNLERRNWDYEIIGKLGLPENIFPEITEPGTVIGGLKPDISEELMVKNIPVIAVASHDTASAIAAVPAESGNFAYISTGTWIMVGIETDVPLIGDAALKYNFTNEGGVGGKTDFHKNIMGLWLIQECRRQWEHEGKVMDFSEMTEMARRTKPGSLINPDDASFFAPGDMPSRIMEFCRKTGQEIPHTPGQISRCVEDSLALKIRMNIDCIEEISGRKIDVIHMFGGGIRDGLLCELTASYTGRKVFAGPVEATAIGNILLQAKALGRISGMKEARSIVRNSFDIKEYLPGDLHEADVLYAKFLKFN